MKVLLVSPGFHGYWRSIQAAVERRGHDVHTLVYDDARTFTQKLANKGAELPRHMGFSRADAERADFTRRAVAVLSALHPQAVLVIKGDVLGCDFWDCLSRQRLPRAVWLYDELRRLSYTMDRLRDIGPVASYSPADVDTLTAAGVLSRHVPLAFDQDFGTRRPIAGNGSEVIFVGARYGERERILLTLAGADVPVRAYGRDWSHHPYDRMRTWSWRRPDLPHGRDLTRADAYSAMASSLAALNIHGDQDGFTMRTFEACGVGALQFVDRDDVSGLYEPDVELACFGEAGELVELCQRAAVDHAWSERLRTAGRRRTLAEHTFDERVRALEELMCSS